MFVKLKGKTRHGKNRVQQHGAWWEVKQEKDSGPNFWGKILPDRLHLGSVDCPCNTCKKFGQDWRWIAAKNDVNFEIVEQKEVI